CAPHTSLRASQTTIQPYPQCALSVPFRQSRPTSSHGLNLQIFRLYFGRLTFLRPVLDTVAAPCRQANARDRGERRFGLGSQLDCRECPSRDLAMDALIWTRASLVAAALAVTIGGAAAQGTVKSVHGDWQVRCDTPPGAQSEQCALIQSVT